MVRCPSVVVVGSPGRLRDLLATRFTASGHRVVTAGPPDTDPGTLVDTLRGAGVAYYLEPAGGGRADVLAAFAAAGVPLLVRLRDRADQGAADSDNSTAGVTGAVPVVELVAPAVLAAGYEPFETVRRRTEALPVPVRPRGFAATRFPLTERELLDRLYRARSASPGRYVLTGSHPVDWPDLVTAYARARGLRRLVPRRTDTRAGAGADAADSTDSTASAGSTGPADLTEAIRGALWNQRADLPDRVWTLPGPRADGVYSMRHDRPVDPSLAAALTADLAECGGDLAWYGVPLLWRARLLLGRVFGERLRRHRPERVETGARVDWWTVRRAGPGELVLSTDAWFCGEACLAYRITGTSEPRIELVGALRPRGMIGRGYWWLLWPVHRVVFPLMLRTRLRRARTPRPPAGSRSSPAEP